MLSDGTAIYQVLLRSGVLEVKLGLVYVVTLTISITFAGELTGAHTAAG